MKAARASHAGHTRAVRLHGPRLDLLGFYVREEGRRRWKTRDAAAAAAAAAHVPARQPCRTHALHLPVTSPPTIPQNKYSCVCVSAKKGASDAFTVPPANVPLNGCVLLLLFLCICQLAEESAKKEEAVIVRVQSVDIFQSIICSVPYCVKFYLLMFCRSKFQVKFK